VKADIVDEMAFFLQGSSERKEEEEGAAADVDDVDRR
jgi:hypothetical protein